VLSIDLNADLGEGFGRWRAADDEALLPLVSSASIACGFHAGDPVTMRRTVALAARLGITVGAHPGYPDLLGFGRRDLAASTEEVTAWVLYQVGALAAVCRAEGVSLRYVKPHGALYNRAAADPAVAAAVADGVRGADPSLVLLGLAGSWLVAEGEAAGLRVAREAFVDRAYRADGSLVPRDQPGAVLDDADAVGARAVRLAREGRVTTQDGGELALRADSLCLHGDTPGAVHLLGVVRGRLAEAGVAIAPFAPGRATG
jgi:UPF0271 protein